MLRHDVRRTRALVRYSPEYGLSGSCIFKNFYEAFKNNFPLQYLMSRTKRTQTYLRHYVFHCLLYSQAWVWLWEGSLSVSTVSSTLHKKHCEFVKQHNCHDLTSNDREKTKQSNVPLSNQKCTNSQLRTCSFNTFVRLITSQPSK